MDNCRKVNYTFEYGCAPYMVAMDGASDERVQATVKEIVSEIAWLNMFIPEKVAERVEALQTKPRDTWDVVDWGLAEKNKMIDQATYEEGMKMDFFKLLDDDTQKKVASGPADKKKRTEKTDRKSKKSECCKEEKSVEGSKEQKSGVCSKENKSGECCKEQKSGKPSKAAQTPEEHKRKLDEGHEMLTKASLFLLNPDKEGTPDYTFLRMQNMNSYIKHWLGNNARAEMDEMKMNAFDQHFILNAPSLSDWSECDSWEDVTELNPIESGDYEAFDVGQRKSSINQEPIVQGEDEDYRLSDQAIQDAIEALSTSNDNGPRNGNESVENEEDC